MAATSSSLAEGSAVPVFFLPSFTVECEGDFMVVGMKSGEVVGTIVRLVCTLVTVSITSSWFGGHKVKRLLLFFSHWLSGALHQISQTILAAMVQVCWTKAAAEGCIKALKFLELSSSNMLAVTNLAICVNLALVVSSHRTMSRVKSVSSPQLVVVFLVIAVGAAAAAVPFWKNIAVSGTLFWMFDPGQGREQDWIIISQFFLEFAVGVCMVVIVALLLIFRLKEVIECWNIHRRIRFYFVLTIIGILVNLSLGICGTLYVVSTKAESLLISIHWVARHIHVALDTLVLYGVLGVSSRRMDERAGADKSSDLNSGSAGNGSSSHHYNRRPGYLGNGNAHRKVHSSHSSSTNTLS